MSQNEILTQIQKEICELVAREKKVPEDTIDIETSFSELGLDSMSAVTISGELENILHIELDPTLLWDFPTISSLSRHLVDITAKART